MSKRINNNDIERINEVYYKVKTYSGTAKITGFSPTTIKKYVNKNYEPKEKIKQPLKTYELEKPSVDFVIDKILKIELYSKETKEILKEVKW